MNIVEKVDYRKGTEYYYITGEINLEGPLRIGISKNKIAEYSTSIAPVLLDYNAKDEQYYPFIPGSSLKGVLRSTFERLAKTYGFDVCQINDNKKEKRPCGKCIGCSVFGSENNASNIIVRDAYIDLEKSKMFVISERPHYNSELGDKGFFQEEIIHPTTFKLRIDFQGPLSKEEKSLIILALNEFNLKRAFIGGGVSRGNGAVRIIMDMYKKELEVTEKGLTYKKTKISSEPLKHFKQLAATRKGKYFDNKKDPKIIDDFRIYYQATTNEIEGCIVAEVNILTKTKFVLKGIEEDIVTLGDKPTIPGSVIKGYLRKKMEINGDAWIERIFGSIKRNGGRSRIVITDAVPISDITMVDYIPENTILKNYILFDNMEKNEIMDILNVLKGEIIITGKTSARKQENGPLVYNKVRFNIKKAWKFKVDDIEKDVTHEIKRLMNKQQY